MRSTFNSITNLSIAIPKSVGIQTDQDIRYAIIQDGTLTGASWTNVDTNYSGVEYDVTASAITNGNQVFSDYVSSASGPKTPSGLVQGFLGKTVLWDRGSSQTGIFSICAIRTGGTDASVFSTVRWEEHR